MKINEYFKYCIIDVIRIEQSLSIAIVYIYIVGYLEW